MIHVLQRITQKGREQMPELKQIRSDVQEITENNEKVAHLIELLANAYTGRFKRIERTIWAQWIIILGLVLIALYGLLK